MKPRQNVLLTFAAAFLLSQSANAEAMQCQWELEIFDLDGAKIESKRLSPKEETRFSGPGSECSVSAVNDLTDGETRKSNGQARTIECTVGKVTLSHQVDCWTFTGRTFGYDTFVHELKVTDTQSGKGRRIHLRYFKEATKK